MRRQEVMRWCVVCVIGCLSVNALYGQNPQKPQPGMNAHGVAGGAQQLEPGLPMVMVHPTIESARKAREAQAGAQPSGTTVNLSYQGGVGSVGVETSPRVYLVFWGAQWSGGDPSSESTILENFFAAIFGSPWLNTVTQYCQGVPIGTFLCNGSGTPAGSQTGTFAGYWSDTAATAPASPTQAQIAAEAVNAAQHFGNTSTASNASAQYIIATSHGNNTSGFGTTFCAFHSWTSSVYGNVAYTDLPYITDSANCGTNFNGLGANAGITIVEGHEMAETITDQFPNSGWIDSNGQEIGDKCAWIASGQGASANMTFPNGSVFPVQSLWSNSSSSGACVLTAPPAPAPPTGLTGTVSR